MTSVITVTSPLLLNGTVHHSGRTHSRHGTHSGRNRKLADHAAATFRKQGVDREWGLAIRLRDPDPVTHSLQHGPSPKGSTAFPDNPQLGTKCSNLWDQGHNSHSNTKVDKYPTVATTYTVNKEQVAHWMPYLDLSGLWNARLWS